MLTQIYILALRDGLASMFATSNKGRYSTRNTIFFQHLGDDLSHRYGTQGSSLRRFPDGRIPSSKGQCKVPSVDGYWKVERSQDRDYSERIYNLRESQYILQRSWIIYLPRSSGQVVQTRRPSRSSFLTNQFRSRTKCIKYLVNLLSDRADVGDSLQCQRTLVLHLGLLS